MRPQVRSTAPAPPNPGLRGVVAGAQHGGERRAHLVREIGGDPGEPFIGVQHPLQVHQPVRNRRRQLPPVHRDRWRVRRGPLRDGGGQRQLPTSRSWKIRSIALDTDGADVVSSSKLINARSASAARRAKAGGLYRTSPSTSIGRPRKSLASRIEPTTVSVLNPHARAYAAIFAVLPTPGHPTPRSGRSRGHPRRTPASSGWTGKWLPCQRCVRPRDFPARANIL